MELIDPICHEKIQPHLGKHVCVVLVDGTTLYGKLNGLDGERLLLASSLEAGEPLSTNSAKAKSQLQKKLKKAKTSTLGGFPGANPAGVFGIELALIALLFAIPFLWI